MATTPVQIEGPERAQQQVLLQAALPALPAVVGRTLGLWHLLSLDAPCVAVCWMLLFRSTAGPCPALPVQAFCEAAALFIAVWSIYVIDRLLDARSGRECLQFRHRFHWQARYPLCVLLCAGAIVLAMLVPHLPAATRLGWLLMSAPLLAYAAMVHVCRTPRLPKTLVTAAFFAGVVASPAWQGTPELWRLLPSAICFGGVCWLNGVLIENWEAVPPKFGSRRRWTIRTGAVLLAVTCVFGAVQPNRAMAACSLSVTLLLLLDSLHQRLEALHLRALADVVLLTPLLFLLPVR